MKKLAMLFCCFSLFALPAWGQAGKPEKPQAAKQAAKPEMVAEEAKKSRRSGDARHCLEKSSNVEIIKCAEAYL